MKLTWGTAAVCIIALAGLLAAVLIDSGSVTNWMAAREGAEVRLIGSVIGVGVSCVIAGLAFVMFETSLVGNFAVVLVCAAWLLKLYFLG